VRALLQKLETKGAANLAEFAYKNNMKQNLKLGINLNASFGVAIHNHFRETFTLHPLPIQEPTIILE
jgi:hypothetical protein